MKLMLMTLYTRLIRVGLRLSNRDGHAQKFLNKISVRAYRMFEGAEFLLNPSDNHTEKHFWRKGTPPEKAGILFLIKVFRDKSVSIVDVGANAGIFSIPILVNAAAGSRAIMVEPNPVMQKRLEKNLEHNHLENVSLKRCAISDWVGIADLHFPANRNMGEVRIEAPDKHKSSNSSVQTDVTTLPIMLSEVGKIDLLKVDVEGLEDRVIGPMLSDGENLPEYIYFEVAHQAQWKYPLFELLIQRDYTLAADFSQNQLWKLQTVINDAN